MAKKNAAVIGEEPGKLIQKSVADQERDFQTRLQERVNGFQIVKVIDAESHLMAGEIWKDLTAMEKEVKNYWDATVDGAHKVWKGLVAKRDGMLNPLAAKKAEQTASAKAWKMEEDRKQAELQRQAQEAARKTAEAEALAKAATLEAEGRDEEAAAVLGSPVMAPAVVIPSNVPKGLGGMTRTTWSAKIVDVMALVKAVAEGRAPLDCIEANTVFLNAQARAMHEAMAYPGVVAEEK